MGLLWHAREPRAECVEEHRLVEVVTPRRAVLLGALVVPRLLKLPHAAEPIDIVFGVGRLPVRVAEGSHDLFEPLARHVLRQAE